jgi:hypothetical protein
MELPSKPTTQSTASIPVTLPAPSVQTSLPVVSAETVPVGTVPPKPVSTRASRTSIVPRAFTLAPGQVVQNLQVSTSPGLQTIQVSEATEQVGSEVFGLNLGLGHWSVLTEVCHGLPDALKFWDGT